nr:hypothetical protein [Miltoncostaea marina]
MDARLDPQTVLGLAEGDGHVIRDAGGGVAVSGSGWSGVAEARVGWARSVPRARAGLLGPARPLATSSTDRVGWGRS